MRKDYHLILGIQPGANKSTIKKAFRRLAKEFHPDVSSALDADERFKEINEAYQILSAFAADGSVVPEVERRDPAEQSKILEFLAAYLLGYELYQQGHLGLAADEFTRALHLNPDYGSAYEYRGRCYHILGNNERALNDLNKAVALDPDNAFTLLERANVQFSLRDFQGAVADASAALKIYPQLASAHNVRGNVSFEFQDYRRALEAYSAAITHKPDHAPYYCNRGLAYSAVRHYQASIADYTQALDLDTEYVDAYLNRANDYGLTQRFDEALSDLTAAINLHPGDHKLYNSRGQINLRIERYAEAEADFQQALVLEPGYALAYLNRGIVHLIHQKHDLALSAFDHGEKLLVGKKYQVARNTLASTISLIRALAYYGKGEDQLAYHIWLKELVPLDARYLNLDWVIEEHQIEPALRVTLAALLKSLPDSPSP